eukprot:TRINITY_DN1042_c0_g1_i1.p1 TRINITY_DN1042_c0_g1~~TRINITY_DN1042_c0_g1_i1.p1  ORF type:complete len:129 (+),score=26.28 TRINITY_DN1042_c0_g1_i1:36-422(+)
MKFILALAALAAVVAFVAADDELYAKDLTTATFDDYIKKTDKALVMFYAPWCGHCKRLKPDYEAAAKAEPTLNFARVDCTEERDLCSKYEVRGYPTLKIFKNGDTSNENTEKYAGARTQEALIASLKA